MHLHFQENTQETLWNNAQWGLAIVNKTGRFIKINPALCELLEYTESELMEKTFQDITHPADMYDDVLMSEQVENGEVPYYIMTKRYLTKRNGVVWAKLRVDRVETNSGEFCHFLSQISPAIRIEEDTYSETIPIKSKKEKSKDTTMDWIKANLKWLIPLALSTIGAGYKAYHEWQTYKEKVDSFIEYQEPEE